MTPTTEHEILHEQMFALLCADGPLTAGEIAARLDVSESGAWDHARFAVRAGYLDLDEFGRFAPWCAWPRAGM